MSRNMLVAVLLLVVAAFLLGYIPQSRKASDLSAQLMTVQQDLSTQRAQSKMYEMDLLAGYVYLQANLKNYGEAGKYATVFFDRVRNAAGQEQDAPLQKLFQTVLAQRDAIIAGLAKGDQATVLILQQLYQDILAASGTSWK